ncbi:UPF0547 protein C16orf87 homolog-like Protein [Elysia marginata]|uniref:UPF0547 protein C16orf87 homolog-like Protein n=1 Tax=Elysia marginata TaxID=1093978 RepID=A0AAV4H281_9GAST|nr:UPF0547 protein C16orf87 homolog-like Protein [Elysia marginata]
MVKKMKRLERQESRTVAKKCPDCEQQCAIALRSCTNCNYSFTKTRPHRAQNKPRSAAVAAAAKVSKASTSAGASTEPDANLDKVGRRFRTKRMRPDFFNSLELDYASRTFRQRKPKPEDKDLKGKKKRGRPKGSANVSRKPKEEKKKEEEEPLPELDDLYANFSQERLQQFSFILDELNCKMAYTMFKPL